MVPVFRSKLPLHASRVAPHPPQTKSRANSPCICNMLNDHCHRVSTYLQLINIIIIIIIIRPIQAFISDNVVLFTLYLSWPLKFTDTALVYLFVFSPTISNVSSVTNNWEQSMGLLQFLDSLLTYGR